TNGIVFVADTHNHVIREITSDGTVTTIAGTKGVSGTNGGIGLAAKFNAPEQIAFDQNQNLYVVDDGSSTIRKISPDTNVTTFAGTPGITGSADGAAATFNLPFGAATDAAGNVYVSDSVNSVIRKITPGGVVTTIAGAVGKTGNLD